MRHEKELSSYQLKLNATIPALPLNITELGFANNTHNYT